MDGEYIQAIIEVLSEQAPFHQVPQVAIGSGENSHIKFNGLCAADPEYFFVLYDAEEFGLELQRHFADFTPRNRVPLSANSNIPSLPQVLAPVKAPFS